MVSGAPLLHLRFNKVPNIVKRELEKQIAKEADKLVSQMNSILPYPGVTVGWTWGEVPKGALRIGKAFGKEYGKLSVTIYAFAKTAEYPDGFPGLVRWIEFGTSTRTQTTTGRHVGKMPASPFFFPVLRANKSNIQSNLKRAVTRAIKKA